MSKSNAGQSLRNFVGMKLATGLMLMSCSAMAQIDVCGSLQNAFGPLDYRNTDAATRQLVESHHFTRQVETLQSGQDGGYVGTDLDYTLRAFPNHPRALLAMMKFSFKEKRDPPSNSHYTVDCWFQRAERFQPDDIMVKVLYGSYLARIGKKVEAGKKLDAAAASDEIDANAAYNLGLAYTDIGRYDDALKFAHVAYDMGFPLPGLRDRLTRAGKWVDEPKQR